MAPDKLEIYKKPKFNNARLLLGFSGWMDGGEVSTGTIRLLIEHLGAEKFADIRPESFYIYNIPGSMEVTAMFRPSTKIEDGLITSYDVPTNTFYCDEKNNLILFLGKEPNLCWTEYAECIFSICEDFDVNMIYFIGSVAGLAPHTREPHIFCSVCRPELKSVMQQYGVKFTNYQGPASIITYLLAAAEQRQIDMVSLVAAIPAYVQGNNPKCIESVIRHLVGMLGLQIELDKLRTITDEFEKKLNDIVERHDELAENILKLEEAYDNEVFDTEMTDLKKWLEQQGIRLD